MKPIISLIVDYYLGRGTLGAVTSRVKVAPDAMRHYVDQYAAFVAPAPDSGETRRERAQYYAGVVLSEYLDFIS